MNTSKIESRYGRSNAMPDPDLVLFSGHFGPIISVVGEYFGVDLSIKRRFRDLVFPRQVACHLLYVYTDLRLQVIGEALGYEIKNGHSITLYAVKSVRALCLSDDNIRRQVIELEKMIEECH